MSSDFEIPKEINPLDLEIGDTFWESCQYGNVKCTVTSKPTEKDGKVCWTADGQYTADGEPQHIDYSITVGYEHYGPRIYTAPAYVWTYRDGTITAWRDG